jgi:hypothetical protein
MAARDRYGESSARRGTSEAGRQYVLARVEILSSIFRRASSAIAYSARTQEVLAGVFYQTETEFHLTFEDYSVWGIKCKTRDFRSWSAICACEGGNFVFNLSQIHLGCLE